MYLLLMVVILLVCLAMMWNEGFWSNALILVDVVFAALIATSYYESLAQLLDNALPTFTYFWDFLSVWLIFVIVLSVLRALTDMISRYKISFKMPIEMAGRVITPLLTGWVMVCFVSFTLHMAPLGRSPLKGSFQAEPMSNNFMGYAPDRSWLAFVHARSQGSLSKMKPRVFDPEGEFVLKYGARREQLESLPDFRVRREP
jgi:hypothetical protein